MKTTHYLIIGAVVAVVLYVMFRKPKKAAQSRPGTAIGQPGSSKPASMPKDGSGRSKDDMQVTAPNMVIPVMTPVHSSQPSQPSGMIAQPRTTMTDQPQHRVMAPVAVVGLHGDI